MSILQREVSSVVVNGVLLPQTANSDFLKNIGKHNNQVAIGNTSAVILAINPINTTTTISQTWHSNRENQGYSVGQIKIPVYLVNAHFEYSKYESNLFSNNVPNLALQDLLSSFCVQAINQRMRQAVYHGLSTNEGLLYNTTEYTFGADSDNKTALTAMNPNFVLTKLFAMINQLLSNVLNRGDSLVITSSLRVINYLNTTIVPLADYQKSGGGTSTIGLTIKDVIKQAFNINTEIIIDTTFENESGDKLMMCVPSLKKDNSEYNLNYAGDIDSMPENTFLDTGSGAIPSMNPELNGRFSGNYDCVMTAGAVLRPEAVLTTTLTYQ